MRITKDLLSGVMLAALGLGGALVARDYNFGTPGRMGAGFFPVVLGVAIALMGVVIAVRALLNPQAGEVVATWEVRPLLAVSVAIVVFGLLIDRAGLVAALVALICIARLGGREGGLGELFVMVAVLTAIAIAIFVYGLNVPLTLFPR